MNSIVQLRHEAEAIDLGHFTIDQLKAFQKLSNLLKTSVEQSGDGEAQEANHITILSGEKGTGKSSVMLTWKALTTPSEVGKP